MRRIWAWVLSLTLLLPPIGSFGFAQSSFVVDDLVASSTISTKQANKTLFVALSGTDSAICGTEVLPCRSIQQAVNLASTGDVILVSTGTYTYDPGVDVCNTPISAKAVVCVLGKALTIQGGFAIGDWTSPNPKDNLTIIDAQNQHRGVIVRGTNATVSNARLEMNGFTITRGYAQGLPNATSLSSMGVGGGMLVELATANLVNVIFQGNRALGAANSPDTYAAGGGLALVNSITGTISSLNNVTILANEAQGGPSVSQSAGIARGAGLFIHRASADINTLNLTDNRAIAGATTGIAPRTSESFGGGAVFWIANVQAQKVIAQNNIAEGGSATSSNAGGAWGGALFADSADVTLTDSSFVGNQAKGGNGVIGGNAHGGAIVTSNTVMTTTRVEMLRNKAIGGSANNSQNNAGAVGGGAIYATALNDNSKRIFNMSNSIIAGNSVSTGTGKVPGGGGGGIWLEHVDSAMSHNTFADNVVTSFDMYGASILVTPSNQAGKQTEVSLNYSIVANHSASDTFSSGIYVLSGTQMILRRNLFAENNKNYEGQVTITAINVVTTTAGFISRGAPNFNYRIGTSSAGKDKASGSIESVDIDNRARVNPDIGASEATFGSSGGNLNVEITPRSGQIIMRWNAVNNATRYQVVVGCPAGANEPEQMVCGTPLIVTNNNLTLTGLTNYVLYNIEVLALNDADEIVTASPILRMFATDLSYFLPYISR
jgi:hypothetical protein